MLRFAERSAHLHTTIVYDTGIQTKTLSPNQWGAPTSRHAYCVAGVKTYFGVETGTELKDRITRMVLLLNAQVCKGLTTPTDAEMSAYFKAISEDW